MSITKGRVVVALALPLALASPAMAGEPSHPVHPTYEELGRAIDALAAELEGLGERWRGRVSAAQEAGERPLISIMLSRRDELGLSPVQVQALERLRDDFQREAIKGDADLRVGEMDLAALTKADPVDMAKVEAKVREIERWRADLRIARIRAIERGKAQLTPDQRAQLRSMLDPGPPYAGR
jgi:hypothetical protein